MTTTTEKIDNIIKKYHFYKKGEIITDNRWEYSNSYVKIELKEGIDAQYMVGKHGSVYLWVAERNKKKLILYVGKAGTSQSLRDRMNQHKNGTRPGPSGSNSGRANAKAIKELKEKGHRVYLYAREAEIRIIVEEKISLVSTEEEAFIKKFSNLGQPLLNRGLTKK